MCMGANLFHFDCMYSVYLAPSPSTDPQLFQLGGRGHRVGGIGEDCQGGEAGWEE